MLWASIKKYWLHYNLCLNTIYLCQVIARCQQMKDTHTMTLSTSVQGNSKDTHPPVSMQSFLFSIKLIFCMCSWSAVSHSVKEFKFINYFFYFLKKIFNSGLTKYILLLVLWQKFSIYHVVQLTRCCSLFIICWFLKVRGLGVWLRGLNLHLCSSI